MDRQAQGIDLDDLAFVETQDAVNQVGSNESQHNMTMKAIAASCLCFQYEPLRSSKTLLKINFTFSFIFGLSLISHHALSLQIYMHCYI